MNDAPSPHRGPSAKDIEKALEACASEPVHIPGSIQPGGCLVSLSPDGTTLYEVSANLGLYWGIEADAAARLTPPELFGKRLLTRILTLSRKASGRVQSLTTGRRPGGVYRLHLSVYQSSQRLVIEIEPFSLAGTAQLTTEVQARLQRQASAPTPQSLLNALVQSVRELTGHERVMVYQFDSDWNGRVIAESRTDCTESFLGHRFPASDIPRQVRELYDINPVRSIPDARADNVPLIACNPRRPSEPLDLSLGALRGVSPVHQRYLHNMGVAASLSLAIHSDTGLWGLLACHGLNATPLAPVKRSALVSLTQMTSQRLFLLKARSDAQYLRDVQQSGVTPDQCSAPTTALTDLLNTHGERWLALLGASGIALQRGDDLCHLGYTLAPDALKYLCQWLERHAPAGETWETRNLAQTPVGTRLPAPKNCCGLLAAPISGQDTRAGWLLFFRKEEVETLHWAGKPEDIPVEEDGLWRLNPRRSFDSWSEEVAGRSPAWQVIERQAARILGENLSIVLSTREINALNHYLAEERQALARANERLKALAHTDPLTQTWNRYHMEQAIDAEIDAALRHQRPATLLLFDIDHFKRINDDCGHEAGDEVLARLTAQLTKALRRGDVLGRWGGEEFVLLATNTSAGEALPLAERLREQVQSIKFGKGVGPVTVSIGVAQWQSGDSRKTWIGRADKAMYEAKHLGRNRVARGD